MKVDRRKKRNVLCCIDEPVPKGEYPLHSPQPLCPPLPGHPLIFLDGPSSFLCKLGVARARLPKIGQTDVRH